MNEMQTSPMTTFQSSQHPFDFAQDSSGCHYSPDRIEVSVGEAVSFLNHKTGKLTASPTEAVQL
jgi:plastocyanin